MKNKINANKSSKQKVTGYAPINSNTTIPSLNNNNHNINKDGVNNNDKNNPFPIWEKVYLDIKSNIINEDIKTQLDRDSISLFFKESKSINIKNYIYIFPLYKSEYKYAIIDLEKEQLIFYEMPYQCFHPVYNPQFYHSNILFTYDSNFKSDGRYNIVEYDVKSNTFNNLVSKGVAPKARNNCFCSFIFSNKLFLFGGTPQFLSDNSLNYLFSYNIKENDWKIEEYNFNSEKEIINPNYIGNNFDVSCVQIEEKNIFYLIGGKYYDEIIYSEINNANFSKLKQAKESTDIIKLQIKENGTVELINQKKNTKNKFGNPLSTYYKENIYIYNKDFLFLFDYKNQDISLLRKRIFAPEIESHGSFFVRDKFLYLIGKFVNYDDCYIFRTNIDKINIKYTGSQKINYEHLLNNINNSRDNNDISCDFNIPEDKKLYLNKIVLSNFSVHIKNLISNNINNKAQSSINLNDINYQTLLIIFKWIYNNFQDITNNLTDDTYKDILYILFRYKAKSLINIFISNININDNNVLLLYDLSNKYDLKKLSAKCHKYIFECLNSKNSDKILFFNENNDIKKKLYENYFCEHKLYMECCVTNLNIHNLTMTNVNNEKLDNIKQLNKNGKLYYCLNCNKVFVPKNNNEN